MFMQAMMADPLLMGAASQIPLGGAVPAGGIQSEDALSSIPGADVRPHVILSNEDTLMVIADHQDSTRAVRA